MKRLEQFRRDVGGRMLGFDLPPLEPSAELHAMVLSLPVIERAQFMESFEGGWRLLLACHAEHPDLAAIVEWVQSQDDVLLLATPLGPTPPQCWAWEKG